MTEPRPDALTDDGEPIRPVLDPPTVELEATPGGGAWFTDPQVALLAAVALRRHAVSEDSVLRLAEKFQAWLESADDLT